MKSIEDYFYNPMKEKPPTKKEIEKGIRAIVARNKAFKKKLKAKQ